MHGIDEWMESLKAQLLQEFGGRLLYVGLQGSYRRGEANPGSDIDVMVVLDSLDIDDIKKYKSIISSMEMNEKACGFICGKGEISNWPRHEIFQLLNDTSDNYGTLGDLVPEVQREDIIRMVHINAANIYHEMCHRFIYSKHNNDINKLYGAYKIAFYILQNLYYLRNGMCLTTKAELLGKLDGLDKDILQRLVDWKASSSEVDNNSSVRFNDYLGAMLTWSGGLVKSM